MKKACAWKEFVEVLFHYYVECRLLLYDKFNCVCGLALAYLNWNSHTALFAVLQTRWTYFVVELCLAEVGGYMYLLGNNCTMRWAARLLRTPICVRTDVTCSLNTGQDQQKKSKAASCLHLPFAQLFYYDIFSSLNFLLPYYTTSFWLFSKLTVDIDVGILFYGSWIVL